jgi:2,4-diaminopentanoate dehydrogenase
MSYRVIQWATGNVGRLAIEAVLAHPELELAAVWVHSPEKAGREFGGVAATNDVDEVLAVDADCVVYTPLLGHTAEVVRILEAGKNVVTPVGWFYPKDTAGVAELEAACRKGRVTLHGTGIHPGGITERFPLTLSALCTNIRHVRAEEFSDIRNYQAEAVVRDVMLFGKAPEEAAKSPMLDILGSGFSQSVRMVGDALGLALEPVLRTAHEMAVATHDLDTPVGLIPAGTVAAQRFSWQGVVAGEPRVTARVNWLMGEDLDPAWKLGGERFEVSFDADPPLHVTFHGLHPPVVGEELDRNRGLMATANNCVNSVPYVSDAEPGVKTYLDLPLIAGRAAPSS